MTDASDWTPYLRVALELAQSGDAPIGANPRVGCVIVDGSGAIVGRGYHRGAGSAHAEVAALAEAGDQARGATAVVTLEPCRHVGRTGPCTQALVAAGVSRVVYAQTDPTAQAGGGGTELAAAGVEVISGVLAAEAERVNVPWTFAAQRGRPLVTWKCAVSLDGRVAGSDGGPTAISGSPSRARVHDLRSEVGAIVVGTGTVLVDDPALTVRRPQGMTGPAPLRVVVGSRSLPPGARVLDDAAPTLLLDRAEPAEVLAVLNEREVRHVLLEGGPTLAAAFLRARCVDRVEWYISPLLLGAGPVALPSDVAGVAGVVGVDVEDVTVVGEDVRIVGRIRYEESES